MKKMEKENNFLQKWKCGKKKKKKKSTREREREWEREREREGRLCIAECRTFYMRTSFGTILNHNN